MLKNTVFWIWLRKKVKPAGFGFRYIFVGFLDDNEGRSVKDVTGDNLEFLMQHDSLDRLW